jgi:GNAT superfamily N-acetyltransferase
MAFRQNRPDLSVRSSGEAGMVDIRRAIADDVPALLPLVAAYWQFENLEGFEPRSVGAQLVRLLSSDHLGAGWLALSDERAVGYLLAVYVFSLEHGGLTAEIDEFFVAPEGRGAGIGRLLLDAAETEFVRAGCRNTSLQLGRGNATARRFYHRHGYRERSGFELLDKNLPATDSATGHDNSGH